MATGTHRRRLFRGIDHLRGHMAMAGVAARTDPAVLPLLVVAACDEGVDIGLMALPTGPREVPRMKPALWIGGGAYRLVGLPCVPGRWVAPVAPITADSARSVGGDVPLGITAGLLERARET